MREKESLLIILLTYMILALILTLGGCGGGSGGDGGGSGSDTGGTGTISLAWDRPETNEDGTPLTDLRGYKIYYGTAPGVYNPSVDVPDPNATSHTLTGLTKGQIYYIVATAYDTSWNESRYSNPVSGVAK
jgi:hypothetical protein